MESSARTSRSSSMQLDMLYGHTVNAIIEDYIYLSDQNTPLDINILRALGITHIINASNEAVPNKFPDDFSYYNVNIEDNGEEDILEYFDGVYKFLCPDVADDKPDPSIATSDVDDDFKIDMKREKYVVVSLACVVDDIVEYSSTIEKSGSDANDIANDTKSVEADKNAPGDAGSFISSERGEDIMQSVDKEPLAVPDLHVSTAQVNEDVKSPLSSPQDIRRDKTVLFHCRLGVSRSATLVIAFLMRAEKKSLKEAFELTKRRRPKVSPTEVFASALIEYEQRVFPERNGDCSVSGVAALTGFRASSHSISSAGGMPARPSTVTSGFSRKTETISEDALDENEKDQRQVSVLSSDKRLLREEESEGESGCCCCIIV